MTDDMFSCYSRGMDTKRVTLYCHVCGNKIKRDVLLDYGDTHVLACNKCHARWRPMSIEKEVGKEKTKEATWPI